MSVRHPKQDDNVRRAIAKLCLVCGKEKVDNGKNWYRNSTCAACYMKRYKKTNPNEVRNAKLKCYYGISLSEYLLLLKKQGFVCAICKRPTNALKNGKEQYFVVDHCHTTKKIRGLLCHACNMRVGVVEKWTTKINKYLKKR